MEQQDQNNRALMVQTVAPNPVSLIVYNELMKSNCEAGEMFMAANTAPGMGALNEDELNAAVKQILKFIIVITGIKIDDLKPFLMLMKKLLPVHYPKITHNEIVYAFELNAMGKLNDFTDDGKMIQHYQQFSMEYLGKVVSAYVRYRNKQAPEIQRLYSSAAKELGMPDQKQLPPANPAARERELNLWIEDQYIDFVRTGTTIMAGMNYDALVELGRIPANQFVLFMDQARAKLIGQKEAENVQRRLNRGAVTIGQVMEIITLKTGGDDGVEIMAKKMAVIDYFNSLKNTNV